jgi:hypothetical protein
LKRLAKQREAIARACFMFYRLVHLALRCSPSSLAISIEARQQVQLVLVALAYSFTDSQEKFRKQALT